MERDCDDDEAAAEAALVDVLNDATTEQLVEALKSRGYTKVILEDG